MTMLSARTPVDITVQRLLLSDPHAHNKDVFQSIELLVERSEIAHLERIVVSMQQQLHKNWPAPQWQIALNRLTLGSDLRKAESVIAILEPAISLLIRRAVRRLQSEPCQMTNRIAEHSICSTKVAA
jgi:hypothetical protein